MNHHRYNDNAAMALSCSVKNTAKDVAFNPGGVPSLPFVAFVPKLLHCWPGKRCRKFSPCVEKPVNNSKPHLVNTHKPAGVKVKLSLKGPSTTTV